MSWKVGEAKQQLSQVLRASAEAPQRIYNRDRLVAAVVSPEDLAIIERFHQHEQVSIADLFAEAAFIANEGRTAGEFRLEAPPRRDRSNELLEVLDDLDRDRPGER